MKTPLPEQLDLEFAHEIPARGERDAVRIRISQKFMAEQFMFEFMKKELTKKKESYNKRTTW